MRTGLKVAEKVSAIGQYAYRPERPLNLGVRPARFGEGPVSYCQLGLRGFEGSHIMAVTQG